MRSPKISSVHTPTLLCVAAVPHTHTATPSQAAEAELKARRRALGNIQFIGLLYKCGLLTVRIIHSCIQQLLMEEAAPRAEDIECLCKLLGTIGKQVRACGGTARACVGGECLRTVHPMHAGMHAAMASCSRGLLARWSMASFRAVVRACTTTTPDGHP